MRPLEALRKDVAYALRTFRTNPGFTAVVVLSIALGIAANTTVFTMVNATLLGALPVRDPGRLYTFSEGSSYPYPDYIDFRDQGGVFDGLIAHFPLVPASLRDGGVPERIWGQLTTANYFGVLGVQPVLGRGFLPHEDEAPGRDAVVVLGYGLWRRRFGGDAGILGKTVVLNSHPYTVAGVAPPGFRGLDRGFISEFWLPLSMRAQIMPELGRDGAQSRNNSWLEITGRLKPGVTREQALAAVNVVNSRIYETYHKGRKVWPVTLEPAGGIPGARRFVFGLMATMMVVVALVLLIACANVANLMLARAAARQKEIGIRLTVGASRGRLIRQLLTESMLVSVLGAAAGFLVSVFAARALLQLRLPLPFPITFDFAPDARVLAFTAALSVLTGILFGLAPAIRATRADLVSTLKDTGAALGTFRRFGLRNALVVVQVTLSLILLVSAGLFLRSLQNASAIDTGMRPDNVLLMAIDLKLHGYSAERAKQFFSQLRQRVAALPGVRTVSFVDIVPLSVGSSSGSYRSEETKGAKETNADVFVVGSRYFETMGVPLLRGRDFGEDLGQANPAAIINETMARRLFPNEDPIGRRVYGGRRSYQVIGVAAKAKYRTLGESERACLYTYLDQSFANLSSFFGVSVAVKTTTPPAAMIRAVREQVEALDRNLAVFNIETMRDHVGKALLIPRLCAALFGVFGVVGLVLATVGLYGVMSYSVRSRTREIGIRMALGARAAGVLRLVARQGLVLVAAGLLAGLAIAFTVSRFTSSLLYGISATDAVTFTAVPLLLLAAGCAAIFVPARRAATVDPVVALRYE